MHTPGHLPIPVFAFSTAMGNEDGAIAGRRADRGDAPERAQDEQVGTRLGATMVHDRLKHINFVRPAKSK